MLVLHAQKVNFLWSSTLRKLNYLVLHLQKVNFFSFITLRKLISSGLHSQKVNIFTLRKLSLIPVYCTQKVVFKLCTLRKLPLSRALKYCSLRRLVNLSILSTSIYNKCCLKSPFLDLFICISSLAMFPQILFFYLPCCSCHHFLGRSRPALIHFLKIHTRGIVS